jgi:hypothetical protein
MDMATSRDDAACVDTVYAVCFDCGHIEPRPAIAWTDHWSRCENCRSTVQPDMYRDVEDAYDALEGQEQFRELEGRVV